MQDHKSNGEIKLQKGKGHSDQLGRLITLRITVDDAVWIRNELETKKVIVQNQCVCVHLVYSEFGEGIFKYLLLVSYI